ncbi:MAG: M15 family metallopeptidase [Epsilonproteobacteria bacterium]|nr:M15 family metallopeptidase [Campylobacterota bacterium]
MSMVSMVEQQWLFLRDIALLIDKAIELNIVMTAGEAYRTECQELSYVYGKTIAKIDGKIELIDAPVKSKTMKSQHLERLAMDFNFFIDGNLTYKKEDIQTLGDFWESLTDKNEWGGNWTSFHDVPHFQRNN